MTAESLVQTSPWHVRLRGGGLPRTGPPRWVVVVAVLVIALIVTGVWEQAVAPFIRRDDWPYLLPSHTPGAGSVLSKDLHEGRWLNTLWWKVIGQHSTPLSASLTYVAAYLGFVVGFWRILRLAMPRLHWAVDALLGFTIFVSALWVQLFYWPGTLTPSVIVAAVGVWTLPLLAGTRVRLGLWLVVGTVAAMLTYPPVGVVLFLAAVVQLGVRRWRDLILLAVGYLVGFALGVLVIDLLNGIVFGHFGIEIAAWRRPNPLRSLSALRVNVTRYAHEFIRLVSGVWPAVVVGVATVVLGWLDEAVRPRLVRVLFGIAVVISLDVAQTLVTGVVTDTRGELWAWLAVLLPTALLLIGSRRSRIAGIVGLAALAVTGVAIWRADLGGHLQTRRQYDAVVALATQPRSDGTVPQVILYQSPKEKASNAGGIMAGTMQMMLRQQLGGHVPRWCKPAECSQIARVAPRPGVTAPSESPDEAHRWVVDLGSVRAVVIPPHPAWI
ncbi:hypothetical protein GCM10027053_02090 [Intrasporangium mesophilum]